MTAFTNAAPAAPLGVTLIGGTKSITVRWNQCPDYDYDFTRVEWSTSSGGTYTLFGTVKGTSLDITGLNHSTTYWIRCAHVDSFGPTALNYSTPVSTATNNFDSEVDARIGSAVISGSQLVGNSIPQSALSTEALYAPLAVIADVRNLVRNSLGDRGTDGWTSNAIQAVPNALDWSVYTSNTYKGKASLIFNDRDATYGDFVPVTPGDQFWCSCYNVPHGGATGNYAFTVGLAIYNKDKTAIDWLGVVRPTSVSGGQLLQGSITVSNSNAVYVKPWIQINKTAGTFTGGTAGDGFFATAITVTRKNKGELIIDGSIFGQHLGVNTVTADKIDTRGLDIRDGAGNVIFSSGTPLSGSYLNQGRPGNLLTNTENSSNERYVGKSWTISNNLTAMTAEMTYETGLNLWPAGNEWSPYGTNPFVQYQNGTAGASATNYSDVRSTPFTIIPNQRYEASVYVQSHRCSVAMYLVFFGEDGVTQVGTSTQANTGGLDVPLISNTTARDLSQWRRLTLFANAPAGARCAKIYLRKYATFDTETVNLTSYAWWLHPYVGEANANQTTFSPYQIGAEWVPNGAVRSDNKITSTNVSTYIASAAITEAYIGTITAAKIDSRNLTIKDAAGNILFGSGNNLDWSRISASSGWLNSNIGISSGALTGIGTGAGTVVANSNIVIDGSGVIQGIGTGAGNSVANFAIGVNSTGQITGIGTGTNTPVSNNVIAQYGNLLVNTENKSNENPINRGWSAAHTVAGLGTTTTITTEQLRDGLTWNWQPINANAFVIQQVGTAAGAQTDYTDLMSDFIAVTPTTNYEFSCYLQTHRCKTELHFVYYDQAGAYISATYGGVANNVALGGGTTARNLSAWARLGGIGTTPSNCHSVRLFIRKFRTDSGQPDSFCWMLYPYVGRAGVNQTTLSAWSPGSEWVPSNTVRPDNKLTSANISNYMNNAVIGQALIGDLAVGTLQIANQAVTVPASVVVPVWAGSGNTVVNNSYTDSLWGPLYESNDLLLCSLTMTTSGAPVTLIASCGRMPAHQYNGFTAGSSRLRLHRDGILIAEGQHGSWGIHGLDRVLIWRDTPSAGAHTYTLYFRYGLSSSNTMPFGTNPEGYCTNSSIIALETKK